MITKRCAGATVGLLLLAACGGGGSSVAYTFNKGQESCRVHQQKLPDGSFSKAVTGITTFSVNQAGFLQDYAPHADQPFCDGATANADDTAWAALYLRLKTALPGSASLVLPSPEPDS